MKKKEIKYDVEKYSCQECDKGYAHEVTLVKHKKSHQEQERVLLLTSVGKHLRDKTVYGSIDPEFTNLSI